MMGPRGSGAPPHFHGMFFFFSLLSFSLMTFFNAASFLNTVGHAVNMLVHGAKRWILFPPQDAFFTVQPGLRANPGFFAMSFVNLITV
jgi:hypothetical protein